MLSFRHWVHTAARGHRRAQKEAGFFSIEMIIVLVVMLSILASSAGRVAGLFSASGSASMVSSVLEIENNVRTLRPVAGFGPDGTSLVQALVNAQLVPNGLTVSTDKIINDWSGEVKIESINGGIGFSIVYPNVPKEVCSRVATQILGSGNFTALKMDDAILKKESSLDEIAAALSKIGSAGAELTFYVDGQPSP